MARYVKTNWNTNSYVNPTLMNHIEQGIYDADLREGGTIGGNLSVIRNNTGTSNINSYLDIGNNIAEGTTGATRGILRVYGLGAYNVMVYPSTLTNNREITLPDKAGTIALQEAENIDISSVTWTKTINSQYTFFQKVGRIVYFQIYIQDTISTNGAITSNLPTSVRPSSQKWFIGAQLNGGNVTTRVIVNGNEISVIVPSNTSVVNLMVSGSYYV